MNTKSIFILLALLATSVFGFKPMTPPPLAGLIEPPFLLADLIPGVGSSIPRDLVDFDGELYFTIYDEAHGRHLWKSDGTAAGTVPILAGDPGQDFVPGSELTVVNQNLYFSAKGLWRLNEDGLINIPVSSAQAGIIDFPQKLTAVGDSLYFISLAADKYLWRCRGDIASEIAKVGHDESNPDPLNLTDVNGRIFFTVGPRLWVGDENGAHEIGPHFAAFPEELTASGNTLYFIADDGSGRQVWQSDGTDAGTIRVPLRAVMRPYSNPRELTTSGGKLYFAAYGLFHDQLYYVENGPIEEVSPYWSSTFSHQPPSGLTDVNGTLFFIITTCEGCSEGINLMKLTGSIASKVALITTDTSVTLPHELTNVIGYLFFSATDGSLPEDHGEELWVSDGTPISTWMFADLAVGAASSEPEMFTVSGNYAFFTADDGIHGRELWAAQLRHVPLVKVGADTTLGEGSLFNRDGSFEDVPVGTWTGTVDYGDGSGPLPLSLSGQDFSLSHTYNDEGSYRVWVVITDSLGLKGSRSFSVTSYNLPPVIVEIQLPPNGPAVGQVFGARASFSDPGPLDSHMAEWDWGDGSTSAGIVSEANGSGTVTGEHTFTDPRLYTIKLSVKDNDAAQTTASVSAKARYLLYLALLGR